MTFGDELRDMLQARSVTQNRLAKDAGLDHSYISRLVAGQRHPTRRVVLRIADALDADVQMRDRLLVAANYMPEDDWLRQVVYRWVEAAS